MLVTVVLIESSDVVTVPMSVIMVAVSPATYPSTASRLSSFVFTVPMSVCIVAIPLLTVVILAFRLLTTELTLATAELTLAIWLESPSVLSSIVFNRANRTEASTCFTPNSAVELRLTESVAVTV